VNDAFGEPQSAVILGATSDIARAAVRLLAERRCRRFVLAGRDLDGLEASVAEAKAAGATDTATVQFDAHDVDAVPEVVARCFAAAAGPVDLVIVAVGVLGDQAADEIDPGRSAEVLTVDFVWPAAALVGIAGRLRSQGSGRVMVLSSVAGVRVRRANFVYGSAKTGLDAFAIGLADALVGSGVVVQVVRPGFVHSKMTAGMKAQPFATTPEVVAAAMVAGLGSGAPVIWVPGLLRWVFLVLRHLPRAIWRRLPS
jgi:decaprenylphospho-beta-D-erythro-pentofuranosid-2-ulose 2-reductase